MPHFVIAFPPGIYRNGTEYQSKGRWYDGNLVRFLDDTIRPIGGWRQKSAAAVTGKARAILTWQDNSRLSWAAIGTHAKLYAMSRSGVLSNITPYRATGTLGSNPLQVFIGTPQVRVTHVSHGNLAGDTIVIAGATAVGGITPNGTFAVTSVVDADHYEYSFTSNASSNANGGGASVTYKYEIHPGHGDAIAGGGYGTGAYGTGTYGTPRADSSDIQDVTVWTLDTFGEYLVACNADDGKIYQWQLNTSAVAAVLSGAPTACRGAFVTGEGHVMALGAGGNPRRAQWSDQRDATDWTPSATNQAGDYDLQTVGKLMCGRVIKGGNLLWTDLDVHLATYTADVLVYSFAKLGDGCGVVAQNSVGILDSRAVWMGRGSFWLFNGFVQPLPCDVSDYVFSDINPQQISKVTCFVNSMFGEVTWHYPSAGSTENDRYVTWNYREFFQSGRVIWTIGALARVAGTDRGAMLYPLLVGSDGHVYEHEVGFDYSGAMPYLEGGPIEPGNGDQVTYATRLIPDEKTAGDVTATFKTKFYPNGAESNFGPYSLSSPTDVRFGGRQIKVRYTGSRLADWRVGVPRLDVTLGGKR